MLTQNDVTKRTQLEMAMAQLAESQLGMLGQVRGVGVMEVWALCSSVTVSCRSPEGMPIQPTSTTPTTAPILLTVRSSPAT